MKPKEEELNLYNFNNGQAKKETIEDMMKRKKSGQRKERIEEKKQTIKKENTDIEDDIAIKMTNRNKIQKEQVKRSTLANEQKKKNKRKKFVKRILISIVIIAITLSGIAFALMSPIFNIKNIEVENNEIVSSETIISLSGLTLEQNIFKFLDLQCEYNIKENAYIEKVKIARNFPDKIKISVEERKPKFSIQIIDNFAYISSQGYILEKTNNELKLPVIKGISTQEEIIQPGNRLNDSDLKNIEVALKILGIAKENGLDNKITTIDISNENDYYLYIEEEKKGIYFGNSSNMSTKMMYIVSIMEKNKDIAGDIYVNGELNNKFRVYFRKNVS